jgi:hypothetical protein
VDLILGSLNLGGTFSLLLILVTIWMYFWLEKKGRRVEVWSRKTEDASPCLKIGIVGGRVQNGMCMHLKSQKHWRGSGCGVL